VRAAPALSLRFSEELERIYDDLLDFPEMYAVVHQSRHESTWQRRA
jgi:hypothetical protein